MNISDEAVEAAIGAYGGTVMAIMNERAMVRRILEAAAPHLMAQAWEEGFDRGFYDPLAGGDRDASESLARNPWRRRG